MKYIFLHGLGQTASSWTGTVESMDPDFDILCPELSEWLYHKEACYSNLYQALEDYCEQFEEPLNLCGLSLGGILALHYGLEHPERVHSLVLVGTQYTMPKRLLQIQNAIFNMMPDFLFQKMGFGKRAFIQLSKSMMDLDFKADLVKVRCRVFVICGDQDKVNRSASLQFSKMIPHAQIAILPQTGHEVNIESPAVLGKALNEFYHGKL